MIGSPVLVIGIFWLGWTGQYANIPWYVPALSTIFLGAGISLIFMSFVVRWQLINLNIPIITHFYFQSYLVDTYLYVPPLYLILRDVFLTFLISIFRMYSASALSANTAIRSAVAAAFPLFTVQLFTNVSPILIPFSCSTLTTDIMFLGFFPNSWV